MQDPRWLEDPWHLSLYTESTKEYTSNQKEAYEIHIIYKTVHSQSENITDIDC